MNTGYTRLTTYVFNLLALVAVVSNPTSCPGSVREPGRTQDAFDLSKIDYEITKEFLKAWNYCHNGIDNQEAVVLIFRKLDGSYFAKALGQTNETRKFRFQWDPAAIAIAHTHPTGIDPKPSIEDVRLSARLRVPIFTMTGSGMYMYDPGTKRTTKVQEQLDWLNPAKWTQDFHSNQVSNMDQ